MLEISCFNGFRVWVDKRPLTQFYSQKTRALLIYLAVEAERAQTRSHLAGLLWPDYPEARARRNLSQTLNALRKDLGAASAFVQTTSKTIALNQTRGVTVDTVAFSAGITAVRNHTHSNPFTCFDCTQQMQQTADLYSGPFLDQFGISDSPLFETWIETQREQFLQQTIDLLIRLSKSYVAQKRLDNGLAAVDKLLSFARWSEEGHQQRMLLLTQRGQRAQALAQYDLLSNVLMAEFGVAPSLESDALYDQIMTGEIEPVEDASGQVMAHEVGGETAVSAPKPAPYYAPAPPPHYVGREAELQQLLHLITSNSNYPIAIVGMAGVGKTAFATYAAKKLKDQFPDGVLWGNSKLGDPHSILDLWARAYGNNFSNISDLDSKAAAVRGMLTNKQALVIIDNVDTAAFVRPLIPNSSHCTVLLTTRNRDVAASLNAKSLPLIELPPAQSFQLLVEILGEERVLATQEEQDAAFKIGEILQYLPLAVEIAAKRLKTRPRMHLADLAQRLENMQQRLGLKISDQAVRASFQVSWEGLTDLSKQVFATMGVFGGRTFSVAAIAAIADLDQFDTEDELYTLMALSLVNEADETRFEQHPLLADFAVEKLAENEQLEALSLAGLTGYYLSFAQDYGQDYAALEPEWDNLTLAIEAAYRLGEWEQVVAFANALTDAWRARGGNSQARQIYRLAYEAARKLHEIDPRHRQQEAIILLEWGRASQRQNDYDVAYDLLNRSLQQFQEIEDLQGIAQAQFQLAWIAIDRNQFDQATHFLQSSETIFGQLNNQRGLGDIAEAHGYMALADSRFDEAEAFFSEGLALFEAMGEGDGIISAYRFLAHVAFGKEDYDQAEQLAQHSRRLSEESGEQALVTANLYILIAIYRHQGKLELAKACGEECLEILRYMGKRRTEGLVVRQLSRVYRDLGDLETAVHLAQLSWEIFDSLEDIRSGAIALRQLGDLHQELDHPSRAKSAWQTAAEFAKQLNQESLLRSLQERLN
ncbi:MAG: tetratricopeptide repeat protein [Chloroflexota bacterium]